MSYVDALSWCCDDAMPGFLTATGMPVIEGDPHPCSKSHRETRLQTSSFDQLDHTPTLIR
jgi:hypothetical protein